MIPQKRLRREEKPTIELMLLDVCGTLAQGNIWRELFGLFPEGNDHNTTVFGQFKAGEITYEVMYQLAGAWLIERGATLEHVREAASKMVPTTGARETLDRFADYGIPVGTVSESLRTVLEIQFPGYNFAPAFIHDIEADRHGAITAWECSPFYEERKVDGLRAAAELHGVPFNRAAYAGDDFNCIPAIEQAGCGIAAFPKREGVEQAAQGRIIRHSLTEIFDYISIEKR